MTPNERKELEEDGFYMVDEPRIYASISKLAELCGVDRRTATSRLRNWGLQHRPGPKNSIVYPVDLALPIVARGF